MKILGLIGTALGGLALILAAYLQFALVPAAQKAEANWDYAISLPGDTYFGSIQHMADMAAMDAKTDFGMIVMAIGLLAFLVSFVPAIKKQKIAWIGVGIGVLSFFLGVAHGTHMFS